MNYIETDIAWPPHYKIKKHRRAKHVKLRTSRAHGLEITVPYRFNLKNIPSVLEENKAWIVQHVRQWQNKISAALPDQINLSGLEFSISVHYIASDTKLKLIERPHHEIVIVGPIDEKELCKKQLISWIKKQSKIYLAAELQALSEKIKLPFSSVRIRDQQTLWGSCTVNKAINLNYKLVFLPPMLMKHVMIHELCHTVYLNHSEKFWALVAAHDSSWHDHKRALRRADQFIPEWIQ